MLLAAFEKNDVVRKAEEDRLLTVFKWMDRDKVSIPRVELTPCTMTRCAIRAGLQARGGRYFANARVLRVSAGGTKPRTVSCDAISLLGTFNMACSARPRCTRHGVGGR